MDTRTGYICLLENLPDGKSLTEVIDEEYKIESSHESIPDYIPIDMHDVTKKQKHYMRVSKHDNRSVLGRKFTQIRKLRRGQRR